MPIVDVLEMPASVPAWSPPQPDPVPVYPTPPGVPSPQEVAALSDDELIEQVTTWAGRVAAGEARLILYIAELDRREAWAGIGLMSCAHWLTWRLGMGLTAARERVRVARALRALPVTAAAFQAGRLSWTQVRAITRIATADDEARYVELARFATGAQIERLARGVRRARQAAQDAADPEAAAWRMRTTVRHDDDGTLVLTCRLPAEHGAVVLAALEAARDDLDHARAAEDPDASAEDSAAPGKASLRDAVLHVSRRYLDRRAQDRPDAARRSRGRLTVQVDPLSGWARLPDGELLPPMTMKQVLRTLPGRGPRGRLRPLRPDDLHRHDLGRTRRAADPALRELLGAIDGERCRFPGCSRTRKLHAHHVIHWTHGGRTDLANLVLLCSRHHTLVHRDDHRLTLHPDRTLTVTTAHGAQIPHRHDPPWQPGDDLDPDRHIDADTLPPHATDRLDLGYAVSVLLQQAA